MASIGPKRQDGSYRARYRDPAGQEHARHFGRKADAQHWLDRETARLVSGTWVDPKAAKITMNEWCQTWLIGYGTRKPRRCVRPKCISPRSPRHSVPADSTPSGRPR